MVDITIKPTAWIRVYDKEKKNLFEGTPAQIVHSMAKGNYLSARTEDAPNVYMYVVKINLFEMFGIRLRVQYNDFVGFLRQMLQHGLLILATDQTPTTNVGDNKWV